jgi:hypothetical protein
LDEECKVVQVWAVTPSPREAGAEDAWLARVAAEASRGAGDLPVELLGDYLVLLADAATTGRKPERSELEAVGQLGRRAAELGISAGNAMQLYLSAAWRWTVRIVRRRFSSHEEIRIGPAEDDGPGLRVRPGSDERQLAALVIVQSLRVDARNLLTAEEIHAAGLADCIDHD